VVQPDGVRPPAPQRGHERHAVPDLDQSVAVAVAAGQLCCDGAREDHVAPGLADDGIAAAPHVRRMPGGERRAVHDLDAGLGPQRGDVVGVDLGPAGLDIVEIAPRQHVDAFDAACARRALLAWASIDRRARPHGRARTGGVVRATGASMLTRTPTVKLTGERPIEGKTPDSLLALHAAGYREVRERLELRWSVPRPRLRPGRRQRRRLPTMPAPCGRRHRLRRHHGRQAWRSTRRRVHRPHDGVFGDGAEVCLIVRCVRLRVLVAPHRALRGAPASTCSEVARVLAPGRHRVLHHAQRAGRLREPVPRVPVRIPRTSAETLGRSLRRSVDDHRPRRHADS
jgi:hypothetical protein